MHATQKSVKAESAGVSDCAKHCGRIAPLHHHRYLLHHVAILQGVPSLQS